VNLGIRTIALAALCAAPVALVGQDLSKYTNFTVEGRTIQVHGFVSQGFGYSDDNNYLTMKTSQGSFAFTDAGLNMSTQLTDKFRVGAQIYVRDIGNLGKWHPQLDWATADYKFKDWFGIRGGVVKTVFGLHNDTQDMEFLHTNALLPQSIYPTDLRDALIRHTGGDVYGEIPLKRLGSLAYTGFAGMRNDSKYGGYIYLLQGVGINMQTYGGLQFGGDLKWTTPLKGLVLGASHMDENITGRGSYSMPGMGAGPYEEHSNKDQANQVYGQYTIGNLRVEAEYRRWWRDQQIFNGVFSVTTDTRGWYTSASYRISKRLELGSYYSRLVAVWATNHDAPDNHLYDKVVTARVDLTSHWNVKLEGHFMDGYGAPTMYPVGFYTPDNPQGLKPKTNFLMVRTGWNF
jgi:hypothetical protein